ncbi:MAG TPA: LPS export ABC transporter periplasmic protein LptC [Stellaceae bacterium]|jgi:lipopolysaccharide export system protein LptC|nr:LPS export ABC transporter periplasmic protein LptC [Stellaceae bacterium]
MAPSRAAVAVRSNFPIVPGQLPGATDRYSRWVALLKVVLPVIGVALLCLVSVWPRLPLLLESMRAGFPAIDLREARELRMVTPRYAGLDRYNRPYAVTAAIGRQVPDRNDVMALERPRAVMTVHGGASVTVTAATGVYQSQAQLLDLFEDVNLLHQDGTRFVTRRAHLNVSDNTAEGHEPVEGHGPSGDIAGEGFVILSKGETIIFTGQSSLVLRGVKPDAPATKPPALPAEVEKLAAEIAANPEALPVALPMPTLPPGALGKPTHGKLAGKSAAAAAKPQSAGRHASRIAPSSTPSAPKQKHDGG